MKRIAVNLKDDDQKTLKWIMSITGCNQTEAARLALDIVIGNFTGDMVRQHYLMFKKRDRDRAPFVR